MRASLFTRHGLYHAKIKLDSWAHEKRVSLHTRDKRIASAKFEQLVGDYEREAAGIGLPVSVREASRRPVEELFSKFLADLCARGKSANTQRIYAGALRKLSRECGWALLRDVSASSFVEWRNDSNLSPKTKNDFRNVLARFFRWMRRQRFVVENPFEFVDLVDVRATEREHRRALRAEEVARLLTVAPPHRRTVYRMALETGLRRAELNRLRWSDFFLGSGGEAPPVSPDTEVPGVALPDGATGGRSPSSAFAERPGATPPPLAPSTALGGPCVRVPASISKNRRTALLPLGAELAAQLRAEAGAAAPFAFAFKGRVPEVETLRRDLARAGIAYEDELGRKVDLHALRKTFGTALVLSGAAPRVVMEAMRHSDLKLTMKTYMDAGQLPVRQAVALLPWNRVKTG